MTLVSYTGVNYLLILFLSSNVVLLKIPPLPTNDTTMTFEETEDLFLIKGKDEE